jgi:hypothetical protein
MTRKIWLRALGVWLILAVLTVLFGAFREAFFIPATGMDGTLARAVLLPVAWVYIALVTIFFLKNSQGLYDRTDTIRIGVLWLVLTVCFEFVFGTLVMDHPLAVLLTDYNLLKGRVWVLFLVFLAVAPLGVHTLFLSRKTGGEE